MNLTTLRMGSRAGEPLAERRGTRGRAFHLAVLASPALALALAEPLQRAGFTHAREVLLAGLLAGLIGLTLLRRDLPVWSTVPAGLAVHSLLWDRVDDLGARVQFEYVAAIDRALGLGELPTHVLQRWWFGYDGPRWIDWALLATYYSFFVLPLLLVVALARRDREHLRRYVATMLTLSALALPFFAVVPTSPPWLAAREGVIDPVFPLKLMLHGVSASQFMEAGTNLVAAMPSLHSATAVVCALVVSRAWPRTRWLAPAYPPSMGIALVYLGEHYVADVVAGATLALVAWLLVGRIDAMLHRRHQARHGAPRAKSSGPPGWQRQETHVR